MRSQAPVNLYFEDSREWFSLPEWAEYFIYIGKQLVSAEVDSRVVTAIAVPTRAYCAAFISLGMIIGNAEAHERTTKSAHFEELFDLPPGTPVIFRPSPRQVFKGILQEPEEDRDGKIRIRVQVSSEAGGNLTYSIDEPRALQVQPARHSGKLPNKQGGEKSRLVNDFVDILLGDADPVQLGLRSKIVCALVGKKNVLEHEIRNTSLAIHVNGRQYVKGQLQDILRVDKFITETQSYRSALVPVGANLLSEEIISSVETGVIFDGAAGFLKWGEMPRVAHQVVILDRTEPYFVDAISAINSRYAQNRIEGEAVLPVCDTPPGSEVIAFREAFV